MTLHFLSITTTILTTDTSARPYEYSATTDDDNYAHTRSITDYTESDCLYSASTTGPEAEGVYEIPVAYADGRTLMGLIASTAGYSSTLTHASEEAYMMVNPVVHSDSHYIYAAAGPLAPLAYDGALTTPYLYSATYSSAFAMPAQYAAAPGEDAYSLARPAALGPAGAFGVATVADGAGGDNGTGRLPAEGVPADGVHSASGIAAVALGDGHVPAGGVDAVTESMM